MSDLKNDDVKASKIKTRERLRKGLKETSNLVYGNQSTQDVLNWKNLSTSKRVGIIVNTLFLLIAFTFVFLVSFAKSWFGVQSNFYVLLYGSVTADAVWRNLLWTAYFILLIWGISNLSRRILEISVHRAKARTVTVVRLISSTIKYVAVLILLFVVLGVWGVDTVTILASAGVIAIIVGLGAQTLVADVIGGLSIVFEEQFSVGDIVVIDDFRGTVQEIGVTTTKIVDYAGNMKVIRNSAINTVINLSHGNSVAFCYIGIDYDEDIDRVNALIRSHLDAIGKDIPEIIGKPLYLGVDELADSSINLAIMAYCKETDKFAVSRKLNEAFLKLFKQNKVNIPFNQLTISQRAPSLLPSTNNGGDKK